MISKKAQAVVGLVAFGLVVSLAYQNCNSGVTRMSSVGSGPDVMQQDVNDADICLPQIKSWQVGGASCSTTTPNMTNGMEQLLIDSEAPATGSATVRCRNGFVEVAAEFAQTCQIQITTNPTNGECGTLHTRSVPSVTQPTLAELCRAGNPSVVMGTGPWDWSCAGIGAGSTTADCRATLQGGTPNPGSCGSSDGRTLSAKPTSGLCDSGIASTVSGEGPWTWNCVGSAGTATDFCMANKTSTGGGGGGGQAPQCGAANVGSRGYTSLSEFTANDYCFTGGSTPINVAGGSAGPWSWVCRNSDGTTSDLCTAMKATSPPCSESGVKTGTKYCTQRYGETSVNCGACIPTVCDTGYQITGSPARCEPLDRGHCNIPAGTMKVRAQSTAEYLSCEKVMSAQTVSPGSSITVSCSNGGFGAVMPMKCLESSESRATDNGGAPFNYKRMHYRHGRINSNDSDMNNWAYAVLGLRSNGYIFDESIARQITYNFACNTRTDYSISSWNYSTGTGFRIQGTGMSPNGAGSKLIRCLTGEDEKLYLVTIECDGLPNSGPEGFWKIISAANATANAGGSCTGGGKTANSVNWSPN